MYSRFANPTVDAVEKKIADLEGSVAACPEVVHMNSILF